MKAIGLGDDLTAFEKSLIDAVEGAHEEWTTQDVENLLRRLREKTRQMTLGIRGAGRIIELSE